MINLIKLVFGMLILLALTVSCSDFDDSFDLEKDEYLIFGHFYGECYGEGCIEVFKLKDKMLSEDTIDKYPGSIDFYEGNFEVLDQELFEAVRDITTFFPAGLLNEDDRVLGMPDAGDWGGLYIEYNRNGTRQFWLLDQKKDNVPSYLHGFIDLVNEKIRYINNVGRCSLSPDPGECFAAFRKYYYDAEEGTCKEFMWGGCNGVVPFHTLEDCETCISND